jgi:hypothetical protein
MKTNFHDFILHEARSALFVFFLASLCLQLDAQADTISVPKIRVSSLAFGGTGILMSSANHMPVLMTGGRGSAVINERFTIGGAGWGSPKGVEITQAGKDTFEFFKFGYGGPELGYLLYPGERIKLGCNLLLGCGAGFNESLPKADENEFRIFPVFEPSISARISLARLLAIDVGVSYRYIPGPDFTFMSHHRMSGFSVYIAVMAASCSCKD